MKTRDLPHDKSNGEIGVKTMNQNPTTHLGCLLAAMAIGLASASAADKTSADSMPPRPDAKAPDPDKPTRVFILLGQSNMLGMGRVGSQSRGGPEGSLEMAVKEKKYPYLVDEAGHWSERNDVRYVRVMSGRGGGMQVINNEWMSVKACKTIGPEFGIAHFLGDAIDAPVMLLKSCIGNRSLGWDLLPPGSERYQMEVTEKSGQKITRTFAGYKDTPDSWIEGQPKKEVNWYAGKQYDDDVAHARKVLAEFDKYCPGAKGWEIAGFFFWQGDKDRYNTAHASRYELNLVNLIKQLRRDFEAPNAKFVLATLGQTRKGDTGNEGMILEAQLAVDGSSGQYPEFKGNVATGSGG